MNALMLPLQELDATHSSATRQAPKCQQSMTHIGNGDGPSASHVRGASPHDSRVSRASRSHTDVARRAMWLPALAALIVLPYFGSVLRLLGLVLVGLFAVTYLADRYDAERIQTTGCADEPMRLGTGRVNTEPRSKPSGAQHSESSRLAELIVRDFVRKWHATLAAAHDAADSFPAWVERLIESVVTRLVVHVQGLDAANLVARRVIPLLSAHHDSFFTALSDVRKKHLLGDALITPELDEMDLFLAAKYKNLHPAVSSVSSAHTRDSERVHLRAMAERLLTFGTPHEMSLSPIASTLAREIIACAVLQPLIHMLTDPLFLYEQVSKRAEHAISEHANVTKLRKALNEQPDSEVQRTSERFPPPRRTSARKSQCRSRPRDTYEKFLKRIGKSTSILDARRMRNDLTVELQRCNGVEGREGTMQAYAAQLEQALALVDKRLADLDGIARPQAYMGNTMRLRGSALTASVTLKDVLAHPSGLSYFLEFMERRGRAVIVRFWLSVESFKDPLEEASIDVHSVMQTTLAAHDCSEDEADEDAVQETRAMKDALGMFHATFYSSPILQVRPHFVHIAQSFLRLSEANAKQRELARQSILHAQRDAFEMLVDDDWEPFTHSGLFIHAARPITCDGARSGTMTEALDVSFDDRDEEVGGHLDKPAMPRSDSLFGDPNGGFLDIDAASTKLPPLFEHPSSMMEDALSASSESDTAEGSDAEGEPSSGSLEAIQHALDTIIDGASASEATPSHEDPARTSRRALEKTTRGNEPRDAHPPAPNATTKPKANTWCSTSVRELHTRREELQRQLHILDRLGRDSKQTALHVKQAKLLDASRRAIVRDLRRVDLSIKTLASRARQPDWTGTCDTRVIDARMDKSRGHSCVVYRVRVRVGDDSSKQTPLEWVVDRRYSEFHALHAAVENSGPDALTLGASFPGKSLVRQVSSSFINARRQALDRYLRVRLCVCASDVSVS